MIKYTYIVDCLKEGDIMSDKEKMIYLNTPITTKENDIIGLSVCAEKLSDAIDAGAQMIAVTSPFGSGKTSIIDLLREKRIDRKKEYILKIPMWSQLHQLNSQTNELHKNFLYQISSLISHRRGTYISRRLSNNYGLLALHANNFRTWFFTVIVIFLGCIAWSINYFSDYIEDWFPILKDNSKNLSLGLTVLAVFIGIFILTKAEIIFSSQKSEKERIVEEDEIIDLYRSEILKYGTSFGNFVRKITKNLKHRPLRKNRYIIVVEDLDRTNDGKSVIEFLTELRKYYLPVNYSKNKKAHFKNEVVFIVNIKSESVLISEINEKAARKVTKEQISDYLDENEEYRETVDDNNFYNDYSKEHLFAKIFDYVLDLQTINIVDYDTILEGLLKEKKDYFIKLGIEVPDKFIDLPGMLWMVRGKTLDIREIKNRLNKAFLIFETLLDRFPEEKKQISFEKCAIVAYLTSAFEHEFYLTDDIAFQTLIEMDIKGDLDEESCIEKLHTPNNEYAKAILELIQSKWIDSTYRMYFYNYPKDSKIYSFSEMIVQNAILYGDDSDELNTAVNNVINCNSTIILDSFEKMKRLKLRLPPVVYAHENLYTQVLKHVENEVILWINTFDKSPSAIEKNISEILRILEFDRSRKYYKIDQAIKFCNAWEKVFSEDGLLKLRVSLCEKFPDEINWYKPLFFGVHNLIRTTEMKFLSITDCINLMNIQNDDFGLNEVNYIIDSFCKTEYVSSSDIDEMKKFLFDVKSKINLLDLSKVYLTFMKKINEFIPEFETTVIELLKMKDDGKDDEDISISNEEQESVFEEYQELINQVKSEQLSLNTLDNISSIYKYDGYQRYNDDVAKVMYDNQYYIDYLLIKLLKGSTIDLSDVHIIEAIKENSEWLYSKREIFFTLRTYIIKEAKGNIYDYIFLFSESFSIVTKDEFILFTNRIDINENNILEFIPVQLVTKTEVDFISEYYCRKNQNNNIAFMFLQYVAKMDKDAAKYCFESLEYDYAIQYYRFSSAKKITIKNLFTDILELDTCRGMLRFMEITKCLDSGYENAIFEELQDEEELQSYYSEIVNSNAKFMTSITLKNLCSFNKYYAMNDIVTERYYRDKKYTHYIVSKTLFHKKFIIDSGEKFEILWPIYIKIFSENNLKRTCEYMSANYDFLRLIIKRKVYDGFSEIVRITLSKVYQDSDCIKNVLEYGLEFAIKYFSIIDGFTDEDAANTFVNIVESNINILASDSVYDNTYEKLWNAPLKARYTKARKRNGYKK